MSEDLAKRRFLMLAAVRFSGVVFAFLGIAILSKRWIEPADLVGGALIVLGAVEVLLLPVVLARRWRTPPLP